MRPVTLNVNLSSTSSTSVAAAQANNGSVPLTLTTAGGVSIGSPGVAQYLYITTNSAITGVNYTVVGQDADGNTITETASLPNNTSAGSVYAYAFVSSITLSATTGAVLVSVGTTNSLASSALTKTIPTDFYARTGATIIVEVTGTVTYTVQETFDSILSGTNTTAATWYSGSLSTDTQNTSGGGTVGANLVGKSSTNSRSQGDKGVTGLRVLIGAYTGGATLTMRVITEANAVSGA